jgi:hypothetical protein
MDERMNNPALVVPDAIQALHALGRAVERAACPR